MADAKKYLDLAGLTSYHGKLLDTYLSVVNRVNTATSGDPVYRYDTKASTLNGVIPTDNVTMSAGPSVDLGIATKKYVDDAVQDITSAMVFKGGVTASTAGDPAVTTLTLGDATLGKINEGYTFKFTANESGGTTFKVGDILIANEDITHTAADTITYDSSKWTLVPSGDDVDVTSVGVSNAQDAIITLHTSNAQDAAITSTGTLSASHSNSGVTAGTYGSNSAQTPAFGGTANVPYVTVNATGHITAANVATITIPDTVASASALGLVKVDTTNGISLDADNKLKVNVDGTIVTNTSGTISVAAATTTTKGVVSVPADGGLTVGTGNDAGKISVNNGNTITKDNSTGVLNVNIDGTTLQAASGTGVISARTAVAGTTGIATVAADAAGGLNIDGNGVISVNDIATTDINGLFA